MIGQGEWTCTVADFTGTMKGAMTMHDGTVIPPTNKSFHIDFCTVARWNEPQRTAHSAAHLKNCLTAISQDFLSEISGPPTVQPGQTSTDYGNVREEFQTRV
jgi:hypothetical protein